MAPLTNGSAAEKPAAVWWDRGKRIVAGKSDRAAAMAGADVVLVDATPEALRRSGLDRESVSAVHPHVVHVWMPPYGATGEWSELVEDPLLLAGLAGIATRLPSDDDSPVAPIVATTAKVHGGLGASAAVAGLVARQRTGLGSSAVVSGLHAAAAQMVTMMAEGLDQPVFSPGRSVKGLPFWRAYRGGDGRWFFLATLTAGLFLRALDALDRMDIIVLPEVAGEFSNLMSDAAAISAVETALESHFATESAEHWVAHFAASDVPCAAVGTWEEWASSDLVVANESMTEIEYPGLGVVRMPAVPMSFSRSATKKPEAAVATPVDDGDSVWETTGPTSDRTGRSTLGRTSDLPLAGITVVDAATFLAAPFAAAILADFGADVVKVEPLNGDPYRAFPISFLGANQRKRGVSLDIGSNFGKQAFLDLVAGSDVLIENFRPAMWAKVGRDVESLGNEFSELIHCTVSAYGHAGEYATAPGFDPVFQALSGMADAQGGPGQMPLASAMPSHDTCTGVLAALGILAALYERGSSGRGQLVRTSLADTSVFLQGDELMSWSTRTDPPVGKAAYRGPSDAHRYYPCQDGWIGLVVIDTESANRLLAAVGAPTLVHVEAALSQLSSTEAITTLAAAGIQACRVLNQTGALSDPFLVANKFSHCVDDQQFGRVCIVRAYSDWDTDGSRATSRSFRVGEETSSVLAGIGYGAEQLAAVAD
jgi:crotonobetainyl-CoA:carnitine CoA-transferase CaiB-like acyl-CoA transferase